MLVFEERGKREYLEKILSEQGREPTTNSTHKWSWHRILNPGSQGADHLTLGGGGMILKKNFLQALVGRKKLHAAQM